MIQSICDGHGWGQLVVLVVLLTSDYLLGKTRRIKSNSIIELSIAFIVLIGTLLISYFFKKEEK